MKTVKISEGMSFDLTIGLSKRRVADLLASALEGGSNYWCEIEEFVAPGSVVQHTGLGRVFRHIDYPLSEGGALIVSDSKVSENGKVRTARLDWSKIQAGLVLMAKAYPRMFGDWLAEKDDANTGDVFLQLCVFGELVYG